jgi:hypothetical protein
MDVSANFLNTSNATLKVSSHFCGCITACEISAFSRGQRAIAKSVVDRLDRLMQLVLSEMWDTDRTLPRRVAAFTAKLFHNALSKSCSRLVEEQFT